MADRCQAITKAGRPCGATVVADGMCAWHAPSWAERRRQWSAQGGRKRATAERAKKQIPETLTSAELAGWLSLTFRRVLTGQTEPRIATAAATLAKTLIEVQTATDLEQRLAALEAAAGLTDQRRGA